MQIMFLFPLDGSLTIFIDGVQDGLTGSALMVNWVSSTILVSLKIEQISMLIYGHLLTPK
jgi:hypothetical protein